MANAVPKSCCDPRANDWPSPAESSTTPVVWLNREDADSDVELERGPNSGRNRNTGRVACEVRNTHFQSSVISVPGAAGVLVTPMVLNTPVKLISRRFSELGSTEMLRRSAGTKLAKITRTE